MRIIVVLVVEEVLVDLDLRIRRDNGAVLPEAEVVEVGDRIKEEVEEEVIHQV